MGGVKAGYAVHRGRAENTLQWYKSLHDNHRDQVQNGSNWSIVVHLDLWGVEDINLLYFLVSTTSKIHFMKLTLFSFEVLGTLFIT